MNTSSCSSLNRYEGALVGLAVGDALGTTLEFSAPGSFVPITEMQGGGPFNLNCGEWTDDTSMALCLAESLIETAGFDARDQMDRYCKWYREGHLSSNGTCFDIGRTTQEALERFEATGKPFSGSNDKWSAGNGSLMRLAPIPMFFRGNYLDAWRFARDSSQTTHANISCLDACSVFALMIASALAGNDKETILQVADAYPEIYDFGIADEILNIVGGSYRDKEPPEIRGTGYVVASLEAAIWAFWKADNFREGALLAVNLGDDADTTGAIFGQLAGAYYGVDAIPDNWRLELSHLQLIKSYAGRLYHLSESLLS